MIVLGGGISGLSAAYYFLKRFPTQGATLIESTNRLGGWIKTSRSPNGSLMEQGPRTIRPRGNSAIITLELVEDLHLTDEVVTIPLKHTAALNRMIYVNKKLHNLPSSISGLFKTQTPFSKPLIFYVLSDLFKKRINKEDESIYDFVHRRFGKEVADYAISSMICGICAGNSKEISVKFLMQQPFEHEQNYGSVIKGFVYDVIKRNKTSNVEKPSQFVQRSKYWSVYSFEGGLETLPLALENSIKQKGCEIMLNTTCAKIEFKNKNSAVITTSNDTQINCDKVISSLPAAKLGNLLNEQHPKLSTLLCEIPYVTVGVVNLEFPGKLLKQDGFGFLVPPCEKRPILGVIYDSCCFPNGDRTILTAMLGGHWFEKYFGDKPTEENILETALSEIRDILGIKCEPSFSKVQILKDCIPQYNVGHSKRVASIEDYISQNELPLFVCGSAFNGVGINDVIRSAKSVVDRL